MRKEKIPLLGIKYSITDNYGSLFKMMLGNGLIKKKYTPLKKPSDGRRYLRLYRFATVGESIIEFSLLSKECERAKLEAVAALVDLYIFYSRALYDELMYDMKDLYSDRAIKLPNSFHSFLEKLKGNIYKKISKDSFIYELLTEDKINFKKIRTIRNAIKENNTVVSLNVREEKVYVRIFGIDNNKKEIDFEEELLGFVFGIAFSLWIMMEPELLNYKK